MLSPSETWSTELWDIDRPKDSPNNPRTYTESDVDDLARLIREFGFRQPIVVDKDEFIVIGHRRRRAAKKIGLMQVPVHVASDLTPEQIRALRIADNRIAEGSHWDDAKLLAELQAILAATPKAMTGFSADELDKLLRELPKGDEVAPEYPISARLDERYDYVIVFATNEPDWLFLTSFFELVSESSYKNAKSIGTGRVVTFARFMEALERLKGGAS